MTLLEAMSLGVNIIAHNVGGIPEVLDYGRAGMLVTDHTPDGYAQVVRSFFESQDFESMRNARHPHEILFKKFNVDENSQRYISIYRELIG